MKNISIVCLLITLAGCVKFANREEVLYRSKVENSLVPLFPEKVVVVIHPFQSKKRSLSSLKYLESAIPDTLESMLESLRTTLAYVPFNGMPFYVSQTLSDNLTSLKKALEENKETNAQNSSDSLNFSGLSSGSSALSPSSTTWSESSAPWSESNTSNNDNPRSQSHYFAYYTNFLLPVPVEVEQLNYDITTNTNYFELSTNIYFETGLSITNIISNQIIDALTNGVSTNTIITNDFIMTPTNVLLLIQEEYPELINYLSFLPIEVRRATEDDIDNLTDLKQYLNNPKRWAANRKKLREIEENDHSENTDDTEDRDAINTNQLPAPKDRFSYIYHIAGTYDSINQKNQMVAQSIETEIQIKIYPPQSTGDIWWQDTFEESPPQFNNILASIKTLYKKNAKKQEYINAGFRTPYHRPKMYKRMEDELMSVSAHYHDDNINIPEEDSPLISSPKIITLRTPENRIPIKLLDTLKDFHSTIINRPSASLRINSNPNNSLVYLNGFYIGRTPLLYATAPIGQQRIAFVKEGFNREEILVNITKDSVNEVDFSLSELQISGSIEITASKPAEVYINTRYQGITPLTVSNLILDTEYRLEVLDPSSKMPNRRSTYKTITLTEKSPHFTFNAQFKDFNTSYRTPAQKALLSATYLSWFTTIAILGGAIYSQTQAKEFTALANSPAVTDKSTKLNYEAQSSYFTYVAEATLYSAIASAIVSCGIMGWYLHSKHIYVGVNPSPEKKQWYAKLGAKF